nr:MAG TPA: cysteine sulfinate desulfinase/cysteine desulfurase [Bacteriophage sp.]
MIYLEYAATNPFTKYPCSKYGQFLNPNANYAYKEQKLLDDCANRVKSAIGAKSGKVVFGGTSSQLIENLMNAIDDANDIFHWGDNQYMTLGSYVEHDSFNRYIGHRCTDLKNLDEWLSYYSDVQTFVLWQGINNLTGEIFPVVDIGNACHKHNAFYICDMTAMIGKVPIPSNIDQWCDCAVWSGHKLGTEGGIGAMWLSDKFNEWLGDFKIHGTPNLAGAMAIADATEDACKNAEEHEARAYELYKYMLDKFTDNGIHGSVVNNALKPDKSNANEPAHSAFAINAIMFDDINADSLQQYLSSKQIYIGIGGSACSSLHDFRVLNACGLTNDEASHVARVSFGDETTERDINEFVNALVDYKEKFVR